MREAASLGGITSGPTAEVEVRDAGETEDSAVAAALGAVSAGARMLIGPLFSAQARAVGAAVGRDVPVVALSNDTTLAGGNLFVFGITPEQSALSVFGFAASRGMVRIGMIVPPGEFGSRSIAAATATAPVFGQTLSQPLTMTSASGVIDALRAASGGTLPDAVYVPSVAEPFGAVVAALGAEGVQILGSDQWSAIEPWTVTGLQGAWFAAPDPLGFEPFALALEERTGSEAGIVAGLAFDGVEMARLLGRIGQQDRDGLLRERGFDGVLGPYRFLDSGLCQRGLAVLNVVPGATTLIASGSA